MRRLIFAAMTVATCLGGGCDSPDSSNGGSGAHGGSGGIGGAGGGGDGGTGATDGGSGGVGGATNELPSDCNWLRSENNCWRTIASGLSACLANPDNVAVLSSERDECQYLSGHRAAFPAPLPDPVPEAFAWRFGLTVQPDSEDWCVVLWDYTNDGARHLELKTPDAEAITKLTDESVEISCGGVPEWRARLNELDCPEELPTYGSTIDGREFKVQLERPADEPLVLLRCTN